MTKALISRIENHVYIVYVQGLQIVIRSCQYDHCGTPD